MLFKSGQPNIHDDDDDDCTSQWSRMDVNLAWVEGLIL